MNKNSFRLNNNLKSFRLDREMAYYGDLFKLFIRSNVFELFGLGKNILFNLRENISKKTFNEPSVLFESLIDFFEKTYSNVHLCVFKYQEYNNSLELYLGRNGICPLTINLDKIKNSDYVNEKASLNRDNLVYNLRGTGKGAKAAINISGYIFAFYINEKGYEKYLRSLSAMFTVGVSDIISAKLAIIENKYTDPRTGLLNSKYIGEIGCKKPYSIVKIDIDDFKVINDTFGHSEGDRVLEELGRIFKSMIGSRDKGCRDGGDEFTLLLNVSGEEEINTILSRINDKIKDFNSNNNFPISLSIGYCLYDSNLSFAERVDIADENMYKLKNKNGYVYRLANKISEIKDPKVYSKLLIQILENSCCKNKLSQIKDILGLES